MIYKNGKTVIKFGVIGIEKQKHHQHKRYFSMKNVDINLIVISKKVPMVKKDLNISLAAKMFKKLDLYVYFSPE